MKTITFISISDLIIAQIRNSEAKFSEHFIIHNLGLKYFYYPTNAQIYNS